MMAAPAGRTLKLPPWLRPLRKAISKAIRRQSEESFRRRRGVKPRYREDRQ